MELLEALYHKRLCKKQKKVDLGRFDGAPCRSPSETSVNRLATGLLSKVLRFTTRGREPTSRPHSWHSTKMGATGGPDSSQLEELIPGGLDTHHTPWHLGYNQQQTSESITDLCVGWDSGFSYLRSPDQYSSRGSLDSLDPPPPSQSQAEPLNAPLDCLDHGDHYPTPAHSSTRSSHSMNLLNKRDSAYSSFSTSSSIPEYLVSAPSLSSDQCCSLEHVPQWAREGPRGHACFMRSEFTSAVSLGNSLSQERGVGQQVSVGSVCYRGNSRSSSSSSGGVQSSKRHSVGPIWGLTCGCSSADSLRDAPVPPDHSNSYTAARTQERPNSWCSQDLRAIHKGSWYHSSGLVASAKVPYTADVQLHTVVEKSPESSPTTRPRQWTALPQPSPTPRAPHTGPVPLRYFPLPCSQGPSQGPVSRPGALGAREALHQLQLDLGVGDRGEEDELKGWEKVENGYWATSSSSFCPFRNKIQEADRAEEHHQVSHSVTQGQVVPARPPNTPLHPHPPSQQTTPAHPPPHPRPSSSSLAPQTWAQTQQEHPLTQLEMALTEVQRCTSPDGDSQGSGSYGRISQANTGGSQGSRRSMSVLEMVSRFERQEHGLKQHNLSSCSSNLRYKNEQSQSGKSSHCGMEDLRNMLERSGSKAHRTISYTKRGSEHTQHRKRHIVSHPILPSIPPVGPPPPSRICGRRHHSVQQKERSYSEPDSLHKIGVSDPETATIFRRGGGEGSVVDRRRMFEVTAKSSSLSGNEPHPQSPGPGPPALRQVQQDVLAQYMQRKRSGRRDQERPHSTYLQPDTDRQTEASTLFSTSSHLSLQNSCPDWSLLTVGVWLGSPPPPGAQSSMSTPRHPSSGTELAPPPPHHHCGAQRRTRAPGPAKHPHGPPLDQGLSLQVHGAESGRSASMQNFLERGTDNRQHPSLSKPPEITTPQHQDIRDVGITTLPTAEALQQLESVHRDHPITMKITAMVGPSPPPVPWAAPGKFITLGAQDSLKLKYQLLPRREASAQELRVQALRGQLVLRDGSLEPLLDTLGSERTIELMEDVFHGSGFADKSSSWQRRGSSSRWDEHRVQDVGSPNEVGGLKTNLDDKEKDLDVLKVELCVALRRSVEMLQKEKEVLQEELRHHRALGTSLEALVQDHCRPNEREKYHIFIGDLETVVNLLLSLSGRLARTEAALYYLENRKENSLEEKNPLLQKHSQLLSQWEDARELKENLERRQHVVHTLLAGHMTPGQLQLYHRLVTTKPALLIRQRHLDDLIRQGEEHLVLFKKSRPPYQAAKHDWSNHASQPSPSPCTPLSHAQPAQCTTVTSL